MTRTVVAEKPKKMNYAIQFYRLMFCLSFAAIHVWQVFPQAFAGASAQTWNLDTMLPFMALSGFFLMEGYMKKKRKAEADGVALPRASTIAWAYTKKRLQGLWPTFFIGLLFGFVMICINNNLTIGQIPVFILNALPEFIGINITGIGAGNNFINSLLGSSPYIAATQATPAMGRYTLNGPLWFIGAIFVGGYFVQYCVAKNEDLYLGLIAPFATIILFATHHLKGVDPMWLYYDNIGGFLLNAGLLKMICLMSVGCIIWRAVDKWRDVELTKGAYVLFTILQTLMGLFFIYRTWIPYTSKFGLNISFSSIYLLSIPFTFFLCWNKDGFTHFMNRKIWDLPGKLALHFYIIHYPFIALIGKAVAKARGEFIPVVSGTMEQFSNGTLWITFLFVVLAAGVSAIILYILDKKVFQPALKKVRIVKRTEAKAA